MCSYDVHDLLESDKDAKANEQDIFNCKSLQVYMCSYDIHDLLESDKDALATREGDIQLQEPLSLYVFL